MKDEIKYKKLILEALEEVGYAKPMSMKQAAGYLGISYRKMYDIAPFIQHSAIGTRKLFTKKDLDAFIEKQRVKVS